MPITQDRLMSVVSQGRALIDRLTTLDTLFRRAISAGLLDRANAAAEHYSTDAVISEMRDSIAMFAHAIAEAVPSVAMQLAIVREEEHFKAYSKFNARAARYQRKRREEDRNTLANIDERLAAAMQGENTLSVADLDLLNQRGISRLTNPLPAGQTIPSLPPGQYLVPPTPAQLAALAAREAREAQHAGRNFPEPHHEAETFSEKDQNLPAPPVYQSEQTLSETETETKTPFVPPKETGRIAYGRDMTAKPDKKPDPTTLYNSPAPDLSDGVF